MLLLVNLYLLHAHKTLAAKANT